MGLDMYLERRHYVGNKYRKPEEMVKVIVPENQGDVLFPTLAIKPDNISYILEEVGCWRKANAIHRWFVDNIQDGEDDCGEYHVDHDTMVKLLYACKQVLEASELVEGKINNGYTFDKNGIRVPITQNGRYIKDSSVAHKLLPIKEGFFFGGTNYDEFYLEDIKDTIKILEPLLVEKGGDYYYSSSW